MRPLGEAGAGCYIVYTQPAVMTAIISTIRTEATNMSRYTFHLEGRDSPAKPSPRKPTKKPRRDPKVTSKHSSLCVPFAMMNRFMPLARTTGDPNRHHGDKARRQRRGREVGTKKRGSPLLPPQRQGLPTYGVVGVQKGDRVGCPTSSKPTPAAKCNWLLKARTDS
jgi:hypothetical protein